MSNPYESPQTQLEESIPEGAVELASRWARLGATTIDGLIGMVIGVPTMLMLGTLDYIQRGEQPPMSLTLISALIGLVAFIAIHGYFLKANGQTLGKKILGIRIVGMDDNVLSLPAVLVKRYLPVMGASLIPLIGQFLTFIDILFIFGSEKRCVHDYIAGTKVVKVSS